MKKNQTQTKPATKPEVEVLEQAQRRQFSASYKLKIVQEADRLSGTGEIGAMKLARRALFIAPSAWRKLRDEGALAGLSPLKRGPKTIEPNPLADENEILRRENKRLMKKLQKAEMLIELQKKWRRSWRRTRRTRTKGAPDASRERPCARIGNAAGVRCVGRFKGLVLSWLEAES